MAHQLIELTADWQVKAPERLIRGAPIQVRYAPERLPECRGAEGRRPMWTIVMFWRVNGGPVRTAWVAGASPTPGLTPGLFTPADAGDLELWFEASNVWGCNQWDSDYGRNFHFKLEAS